MWGSVKVAYSGRLHTLETADMIIAISVFFLMKCCCEEKECKTEGKDQTSDSDQY